MPATLRRHRVHAVCLLELQTMSPRRLRRPGCASNEPSRFSEFSPNQVRPGQQASSPGVIMTPGTGQQAMLRPPVNHVVCARRFRSRIQMAALQIESDPPWSPLRAPSRKCPHTDRSHPLRYPLRQLCCAATGAFTLDSRRTWFRNAGGGDKCRFPGSASMWRHICRLTAEHSVKSLGVLVVACVSVLVHLRPDTQAPAGTSRNRPESLSPSRCRRATPSESGLWFRYGNASNRNGTKTDPVMMKDSIRYALSGAHGPACCPEASWLAARWNLVGSARTKLMTDRRPDAQGSTIR